MENALRLCKKCIRLLFYTEKREFGFGNSFPKLYYQSYAIAPKYFSFAKEAIIARAYLVVSILKLRLNGAFNLATYNFIRGHAVVFSYNYILLLNLLPSLLIELHNVICIVWAGDEQPFDYDLKHFI